MANATFSFCPPPFLPLLEFPYKGGLNSSRLCQGPCCLPCPMADWVYPDRFSTLSQVANWISLGSVVCCFFLLLSFIFLPVQRTSRHYLTVCLVSATGLLCLSFIVPLGARPKQCYDAITPNDMYSDIACAFSGSLVLFGGMGGAMWIFIRSLSLHLQICWQIVPGKKFFLSALAGGWGVPALVLTLSLVLSGVSYRFGSICHINHQNSIGTFWGPLLTFTGLAAILQFITFGYCLRVYLRNLMDESPTSVTSSNLPSFQGSVRTMGAKQTYRRVRKVIALQWRGVMVVLILIISVVYFAVIFLKMDSNMTEAMNDIHVTSEWLKCLIGNQGNKNICLQYIEPLITPEASTLAVLYLIALMGFWNLLFLGRLSMFAGWWEAIKRPFRRSRDHFVSVDARRLSDPRNYEMLTSPPQTFHLTKGATGLVATAKHDSLETSQSSEYTPKEQIAQNQAYSFSRPRPPTRSGSQGGHVKFSQDRDVEATPAVAPPVRLAHSPPPEERTWERSTSALGADRSGSALGARSGSALGRDWEPPRPPVPPARSAARSPTPNRSNSALGRAWDPRDTYARSGALSPEQDRNAF